MAYVVARPKGRFEIRESLHTPDGPRARSLAGFNVLSDAVLTKAAGRAQRPFDVEAVLASARRAGAPTRVDAGAEADDPRGRFVEASRRMARALQLPPARKPVDPGAALIELLGFADAVTRNQGTLTGRIVAAHELLDSMDVPHQFGGAVALAWYRNPRATTDVDLNVTVAPEDADPVLGALTHLGVSVSAADRALIKRDGQARLDWGGSYLDLFFATFELHREMAERSREVSFGPVQIPILSPEHLIVCKVVFDRPKDWLDVGEMIAWGTAIDAGEVLGWLREILGEDSEQYARLAALFEPAPTA